MVDNSLSHPNMCCEEYAERIGIASQMKEATRKYAEWSVAAEMRLLAKEGVKVRKLSEDDIRSSAEEVYHGEQQWSPWGKTTPSASSKTKLGK